MNALLRKIIAKYSGNDNIDENQNLLDLDIPIEHWLYVIDELEEQNIPIIQVLEKLDCSHFNIHMIIEQLALLNL